MVIDTNGRSRVKFKDGTELVHESQAINLGAKLDHKCNIHTEVKSRLAQAHVTWQKLFYLWRYSDCSVATKLLVWDVVIRAKVVYGLESVQLTKALRQQLNAFQLKGLRRVVHITTTFVDRAHTNAYVFNKAATQLDKDQAKQRFL